MFISYVLETIQLQRQGVIRGLNLQGRACYFTVFSYWVIGIPMALLFAFKKDKGIEGLRVGLLVTQLLLVSLYSILIDGLTNWEDVWHEVQQRLGRDLTYLEK